MIIRMLGLALLGVILFSLAMIVLTVVAEKTYRGDPTGRGAFSLSLFITLPISAIIGLIAGLFVGQ